MTPTDFCFWLNGAIELGRLETLDAAQVKAIREHLGLVFEKTTPPVGSGPEPKEGKLIKLPETLQDFDDETAPPMPFTLGRHRTYCTNSGRIC